MPRTKRDPNAPPPNRFAIELSPDTAKRLRLLAAIEGKSPSIVAGDIVFSYIHDYAKGFTEEAKQLVNGLSGK